MGKKGKARARGRGRGRVLDAEETLSEPQQSEELQGRPEQFEDASELGATSAHQQLYQQSEQQPHSSRGHGSFGPGRQPQQPQESSSSSPEPAAGSSGGSSASISPRQSSAAELARELRKKVTIADSPKGSGRIPPKRRAEGRRGRSIPLVVNHIEIMVDRRQEVIFMHDLEVEVLKSSGPSGQAPGAKQKKILGSRPGSLSKEKRRVVVMEHLFRSPEFRDIAPVFDGNKVIYTNRQLPIPPGGKDFRFFIRFENPESDPASILVKVKEVKAIEMEILRQYVARDFRGTRLSGSSLEMPQDPIRAVNSVFRAALESANYMSMGNYVISNQSSSVMQCGPYDVHDGLFFSVRPQRWTIRLNVDKTQAVLRQPMSLVDYVYRTRKNNRMDDHSAGSRPFAEGERKQMENELRGMRVSAGHFKSASGKAYSRKFTVQGLSKVPAREQKIPDLNMSVVQYTEQTYGVRLKYPHWPCVCTSREKKTMFPLELMTMEPFQRAPNRDPQITREIIRHAAIPAFKRRETIEKAVMQLHSNGAISNFLRKYFINVSSNLHRLKGRVLDPPIISSRRGPIAMRPGSWQMRDPLVAPHTFSAIYVLNLNSRTRSEEVSRFTELLLSTGRKMGMQLPNPRHVRTIRYERNQVIRYFDELVRTASPQELRGSMVIVILPFEDEAYGVVKSMGDDKHGISTQCVKEIHKKSNAQTATNILLKMNAKMNGVNWSVNMLQGLDQPVKEPFIVFGADVTHPAPTGQRKITKSIAAVVASCDKAALKYTAKVRMQSTTFGHGSKQIVELIENMDEMVKALLQNYYRQSRLKPSSIIFYRDGVSEGQFKDVMQKEVAAIQRACAKLEDGYQPGITFIVVQKRHHTRLFPERREDAMGKSANVPAGTVVDTDIVHPREFDFFLCSHEGIQGTSKPTHYHVLWDDNNWGSDDLQCFTYYLCHAYMRCTRSVSYPASTYYAHLAAFRARATHGDFEGSDSGSETSSFTGSVASRGDVPAHVKAEDITPKLGDRQYWV